MAKEISFFDQVSDTISPEKSFNQILLEINEQNGGIEEACEIIGAFQIEIRKTEIFQNPDTMEKVALVEVYSEDVHDVVLKLVEKGFLRIIGFKAMRAK